MPFLGPNQVITSDLNIRKSINYVDAIYFTDSGPFGETSIENPKGSVFMVDLEGSDIKAQALAYRCLAHPSGLALSHDEKNLFVSETCENRIIRFVLTNSGIYAFRY
jgi:sugar lactone lactonase YvrE